jgi:hypothetical protein
MGARLDTGGWLALTRQGLPAQGGQVTLQDTPSFLGAITTKLTCRYGAQRSSGQVQRLVKLIYENGNKDTFARRRPE